MTQTHWGLPYHLYCNLICCDQCQLYNQKQCSLLYLCFQNKRRDEVQVEERTGAGTDHSSNSKESPPLIAFELLPPLNFTPFKSAFSPFYPSPPRGSWLRRPRRKKRSVRDLMRRRQHLIAYQLTYTPPSTPSQD